ncbi:VOC family protein [Paracoccus sp. 11-3]|uniref:VOC family protein n=1 Tax=Paracoccus amoyensis TaxID=2760093 RepID=A0A926JBB8_9RHOB|nr:VOC family protein [Paracoccus amoyensis]MBC9245680.1 VOC family protein [Paracoccus amoyensis]
MKSGPAFDHIAIATRDLTEGAAWLQDKLGVSPSSGGKHPLMGTHNMLLSLGPGEYLELIAFDPAATAPARYRWFGLDGFDGPPRLAGWIMRADLDRTPAPKGTSTTALNRGDLHWRLTLPGSGQMPNDGASPMLIDWGDSTHPSSRLPDLGLRLSRLLLPMAAPLPDDPRIRSGDKFQATITTPNGDVLL